MINCIMEEILKEWKDFYKETTNKGIIRKINKRRKCSVGPPLFIENEIKVKKLVNRKTKKAINRDYEIPKEEIIVKDEIPKEEIIVKDEIGDRNEDKIVIKKERQPLKKTKKQANTNVFEIKTVNKEETRAEPKLSLLNSRRRLRRHFTSDEEDNTPFEEVKEEIKTGKKQKTGKEKDILGVFERLITDTQVKPENKDLKSEYMESNGKIVKEILEVNQEIVIEDFKKENQKSVKEVNLDIKTKIEEEVMDDKLEEIKNEIMVEKSKNKKPSKTKKKPVVLKRAPKKKPKINIPMNDINEKLEFIKLGRKESNQPLLQKDQPTQEGHLVVKLIPECKKENEIINLKSSATEIIKIEKVDKQLNILKNEKVEETKREISPSVENTNSRIMKDVTDIKDLTFKKNVPDKQGILKKKNALLKDLFKKEKSKIEAKRNSVFLEEKKDDVDKIISKVLKTKPIINKTVPTNSEFMINPKLKNYEVQKEILKKEPEIKKEIIKKEQENKLVNTEEVKLQEKNKIYDVKSSKFIRDPINLYKKVIDSQRKFISQNDYKSSTVIPHIKSDEEDSLIFIEPSFCKDPEINQKVCKQDHDILEEYFNLCEEINVVEIFPNIKDISNESPNRWK